MASPAKRIDRKVMKRALWLMGFFVVATCVLVYALFDLQVLKYDYYRREVLDQLTYETEVNPDRGTIYDTNGNTLATNATVYLVFISPQDILDAMAEETDAVYTFTSASGVTYENLPMNQVIARGLSEILGVDYDTVIEKAAKNGRRYEVIKKNINEESADLVRAFIKEHGFTRQIYLRASSIRYYPYDTLASHAIGFTNVDGEGIYGLEAYYNNIMEGTSGRYVKAQDAHNKDMPFDFESYVEAENGYNIVTTLDMYIQYELENQLKETYYESGAGNRVTGIVMDVDTGGILGMATYPSFDLNQPYSLDVDSMALLSLLDPESDEYNTTRLNLLYTMWKNKAVTELYEPGSTFKILTTAMALEEKAVKNEEMFFCSGELKIDGYPYPIHCHKKGGHGSLPFYQMLQQSCNPTMMQIAGRIGRESFYQYFNAFGYQSLTGIDLPGESPSITSAYKDFTNVSLAVYAFGQTFKTTPIQQLAAVSAIANGGYLVTPHLLKEIVDDDGNVVQSYEAQVRRQVISEATCEAVTAILEDGVSGNGGAKNAYVKGYKVAAKTGTSEKRDKLDANGEKSYRVGSCVAYAPADDPKVAVLIMVDEPMNGSVYGSVVAAPYVSKLLSFVLPYLGVEAQYTEEELKKIEISVPNYVNSTKEAALSDLKWRGISYTVVGDGETVTAQVPAAGSTIFKDSGKLILYTGEEEPKNTVQVPDLVGKTAEAANRLLVNAGLNVSLTGATNGDTATVISQTPAAGTSVPSGTVVSLDLRHLGLTDD